MPHLLKTHCRGLRDASGQILNGTALFLGVFTAANVIGEWVRPGFDMTIWWIDLRGLRSPAASIATVLLAISLISYGFSAYQRLELRILVTIGLGLGFAALVLNTINFYRMLADGRLRGAAPVPVTLIAAIALAAMLWRLWHRRTHTPHRLRRLLAAGGCALLFPLLQIYCFGDTDYRRPADAIVVFGALAHADGTPSAPLAARLRTACELYHNGLAPLLVFSGGPGRGSIHEVEAMRNFAIAHGVPRDAIMLDYHGLSTRETVENTVTMFAGTHIRRVLAVSNFYHLARIKLTCLRSGLDVYTVPADDTYTTPATQLAREVAAFWSYYLLTA
jgi:uncharacterized SAM-binding protein YcdF (DUF218 family)